jgi:hypothetical protein
MAADVGQSNRGSGERFTRIPRRFHDALRRDDVNARQYLLGCYLAGEVDFRTGEIALTLDALTDGVGWDWSQDTLLRDLKALRPTWLDFETRQGQRRPYVFRLTGLRIRAEAEPPHDFRTETPSPAEVTSKLRMSEQPTNPPRERVSAPPQPPPSGSPKTRTDEKRQETFSKREDDHQVGPGTREPEPPDATDRILDALDKVGSEKPGVGAEIERARAAAERRSGDAASVGPGVEMVPSSGQSAEPERKAALPLEAER